MGEYIFWISCFGVFYAYFGYPLLLWVLIKFRNKGEARIEKFEQWPRLSVIITCRNEAGVVREKIENTLSLLYQGKQAEFAGVEIIVASDASDDGTDEVVREFSGRGVKLVRVEQRNGKEFAQREAIRTATGEILFFTDAKTRLEVDALQNAIKYFADKNVGAISSFDKIENDDQTQSGEGFYVRYEMWLRKLESEYYSLIGLSGSGFAVRREVCDQFRIDIPSDFNSLINAIRLGYVGKLGMDVVCSYRAVQTAKQEFNRKVRTVLRGITTLFSCSEFLNFIKYPKIAFELVSHKVFRWSVPWFCILAMLSAFNLAETSSFYALISALIIAFLLCAAGAAWSSEFAEKKLFKIPLFFVVTNASIFLAWLKYWSGARSVTWDPSERK